MADDPIAKQYIEKYNKAKAFRENWVSLFEECYEYALPQRESFYYEEAGQRRDDKIFDETAVVGVQEFASRLQSGIVPNFARWADLMAGSEVPPDQREAVMDKMLTSENYIHIFLKKYQTKKRMIYSYRNMTIIVKKGNQILLEKSW